MKLQVNTAGAWKDVLVFDVARAREVIEALRVLNVALGQDQPKWCLVNDSGARKWLEFK